MKRVHLFIDGRVQGVGFRHFTKKTARNLGVNGWVRNLHDGRVEAVFEGKDDRVEEAVKAVKKGPPLSYVSDVNMEKEEYHGEFNSFRVSY